MWPLLKFFLDVPWPSKSGDTYASRATLDGSAGYTVSLAAFVKSLHSLGFNLECSATGFVVLLPCLKATHPFPFKLAQ